MGFSPGIFHDRGDALHWEGKGNGDIVLWNCYESKAILWMTKEEAREAANQLQFLVDLAENDAL